MVKFFRRPFLIQPLQRRTSHLLRKEACTAVATHLDSALAAEGDVYAVKADIAEIPEMAGRFHVLTAPAWLLFYQGKEVERMARFIPQAQMKQTLAKWTKVAESEHQ